ncbi:PD-(D/E)XK nuclease family transposase [Dorea longicatena]|uniref:PD-(D/E)XK nuclease family transposase n=1 Tax=Dorea longicatena TaxID=88431 RepID=UPI0032C16690
MMNKLQQYFPMIRTKEEVLKEIENNSKLKEIYENWQEDEREEFLAFVTGTKGVKMMYDFISKAILNPEIYEERVEEFLSLLLQQKVKILEVLPNEETGLSDGYSILIMDIVVELENGSIVNLEIQKNGYMFPGERSACYSADLLLRQYRRVRKKNKQEGKKTKSCYRDIKDVYTIVLFETSPSQLHKFRRCIFTSF